MNPEVKDTKEYGKLVRISSVPGFANWLYGRILPEVEDEYDSFDWAYFEDYIRFRKKLNYKTN